MSFWDSYNAAAQASSQGFNVLGDAMRQFKQRGVNQEVGQKLAAPGGPDYAGAAQVFAREGDLANLQKAQAAGDDQRKTFLLNAANALLQAPEAETQTRYMQQVRPALQQMGAPEELLRQLDTADKSHASLRTFAAALGQAPEHLTSISVAGDDGAQDTILINGQGEERKRFKGYADPLTRAYRTAQINALEGKTEAAQGKLDDKAAKLQAAAEARQFKAQAIIGAVDDVLGKIGQGPGGFSGEAGFVGAQMSQVPGTKAYDVRESLETIKSNLGFEELAAMRAASPTGGALGAIAVQELKALQSTVGNLDIGQSHDQLVRELNKIKGHYTRWLEAVQQSESEPAPAQGGGYSRQQLIEEARRRGLPL